MPTAEEHRKRLISLANELAEVAKNADGQFTKAAHAAYLLRAPDNTATAEELKIVGDWMEQLIQLASAVHMVFIGAVDMKIEDGQLKLGPIDNDPAKMIEIGEKYGAVFSDELKQKVKALKNVQSDAK